MKQTKTVVGIRREGKWTRRRKIDVTVSGSDDKALTLDDGDVALTVPVKPLDGMLGKVES